jgi:Co/Zn/Cd efflux system component
VANIAIIIGGVLTAYTHSIWPDIAIGLFVVALNIGAAFEVYEEAMEEDRSAAAL